MVIKAGRGAQTIFIYSINCSKLKYTFKTVITVLEIVGKRFNELIYQWKALFTQTIIY